MRGEHVRRASVVGEKLANKKPTRREATRPKPANHFGDLLALGRVVEPNANDLVALIAVHEIRIRVLDLKAGRRNVLDKVVGVATVHDDELVQRRARTFHNKQRAFDVKFILGVSVCVCMNAID